jgi:hypothetical protein
MRTPSAHPNRQRHGQRLCPCICRWQHSLCVHSTYSLMEPAYCIVYLAD